MQLFADYHIHSRYSDGRATIRQLAEAALAKGLEAITICDHGPNNIGAGVKSPGSFLEAKQEARKIAKDFPNLELKVGAEANVIGLNGEIDVPEEIYKKLDWLTVGLHPYIWPKDLRTGWSYVVGNQLHTITEGQRRKCIERNTKALVEAIRRHKVDVVAHPGLGVPVDIEEVAKACAETNTAFEINTGHRYQYVSDLVRVAKTGVKFVVNSDAHYTDTVGDLDYGLALLQQAKIPPEQVINGRH
jgi:putative hydrolase